MGAATTARMAHDMFALGAPLAEKILRPLLVYLFLIAAFRAVGKRVLAQLNPFDLVVLLILSNTVQNAIIGSDNSLSGGIVSALTLFGVNAVMVRWTWALWPHWWQWLPTNGVPQFRQTDSPV